VRRIHEAGRYLSLDRLALSPQCGFALQWRWLPRIGDGGWSPKPVW
jgi:hypothetical protein